MHPGPVVGGRFLEGAYGRRLEGLLDHIRFHIVAAFLYGFQMVEGHAIVGGPLVGIVILGLFMVTNADHSYTCRFYIQVLV